MGEWSQGRNPDACIRLERDGWLRDLEAVLAAPSDVWTKDAPRQRAERPGRDDASEHVEVIAPPMNVDVFKRADGEGTEGPEGKGRKERKVEILFGDDAADHESIVEVSPDADPGGAVPVRKSKRVQILLESLGQSDDHDDVRARVRAGTLRELGVGPGAADIQALREEVRALRRDGAH